ncbi:hypothetical protein KHA96_07970 [Bacillus sp. FJAT-49711]|uniref:hypothetical protein n=1 Tax=Bacillus sp. FJAT-49711 TaxID=2833585 RepID=UPI001BC92FF1|nr:hypothetical protein [Bacillus sp. FJAT-49711]MBS4218247.1 hypothetical protein [Bacillus sp. FJAT-49711]
MEHSKTILREYIAYLCSSLRKSLDRVLIHQDGKATVRDALKHNIHNANQFKDQVLETRRIHHL